MPRSLLRDTHPNLRQRFLHSCDKRASFDDLTTGSGVNVMWLCHKTNCVNHCRHIFKAPVCGMTSRTKPINCPYCAGQKVCTCNSFAQKSPNLAIMWDYELNGGLKPTEISQKSNRKCHFRCLNSQCGHHKWTVRINDMVRNQSGCPFCSNPAKQFCECFCLFTEQPDLMEFEWDYVKNMHLDFLKIGPQSHQKAWWKCKVCCFEWKASIYNRTLGTGCPKCASKSKMEAAMLITLNDMVLTGKIQSFSYQWPIPGGKLQADFFITTNNNEHIIIEMDGIQHFFPRSFGSKSKCRVVMFKRIQQNDREKNFWCIQNNIKILRISYIVPKDEYEGEIMHFIHGNTFMKTIGLPTIKNITQ